MRKSTVRGSTTRGDSSIRGGKTRGSASGRGPSTSKSINTLTARGGSDASPIRNTVVARGGLASRGKGKDPLLRTRDDSIEKNGSKKSEKKIYKVSLTNAIVKKLIAAKSKGIQMKINVSNVSDKMEIDAGEGEKIQLNLNLSSPKKVEMIYIRNDNIVEPIGNIIGCVSTTMESHEAAKRDLTIKKMMKEAYEEESKRKRRVQVLEINKIPSEQGKTKSKRQKNNAGSSIKVQQSPPVAYLSSSKVSSQLLNITRGSKPIRGKTRGGRTKTSISTTGVTEVTDVNDESTITNASVRGGNVTRSGKTTGGGKSTRGRVTKTTIPDAQKVSTFQSTTAARGKRGRPAGVTNRTTRGAKTNNTMATRNSTTAFKTSATVKNDNDQLSMSEGTTSSSSKKGKGKTNGQPSLSEWKPGQTITILTEFKQARKICEEMENDIQEVIDDLGAYESYYNTYISSIKNVSKGSNHDLLREIEKQFGEGSQANKLMQKYLQLEKDIKIIYDELWRAAKEGPLYEN